MNQLITVENTIKAPVEKVWKCWTEPEHIKKWNNETENWHTTYAENNLKVGGKIILRMTYKNGSIGLDFEGIYKDVIENEYIEYKISDGRKVKVFFWRRGEETQVMEILEAEKSQSIELQQAGWQTILDNFKKYTEKAAI